MPGLNPEIGPQNIDITLGALRSVGFTEEDLRIDIDGNFINQPHVVITLNGSPPAVYSGNMTHVHKDNGGLSINLDTGEQETLGVFNFSGIRAEEDTTIENK